MAIFYNIYANDGRGGPVVYDAPIATTSGLTWTTAPLAFPSDNTFNVRALDAASGIEEANTDATFRIILDASGNDVTAQPGPVSGLAARATAGGTCWVSWSYDGTARGGLPSRFEVSLSSGATPSATTLAATIPFQPGVPGYGCTLSGLVGNTTSLIEVQAVGASDLLTGPTRSIELDYWISELREVDALAAVAAP